ncbi:MAG: nucleotidyltransferase domain-containing protein [Deltaproteobacteria bacterium]|nr:nucleotidyltransferase domain-containing protein [Deltaproteobacteria bacterium]
MELQAVIDELRCALAGIAEPPLATYLFGSVARGTARPDSDIDLGVLLGAPPPPGLLPRFELEGQLERELGLPTQLVILDTAPPDLVHRVLRDGVLVQERDRSARIRFEVAARNAYFDILPFLQRYRQQREARKKP